MSKYSKSGRRSQSGAGNHFDKLIKVCSNSKVAGTLGRFGVASFTSIRSTVSNNVQEEEKKPKSKYASFKKRTRLPPEKKVDAAASLAAHTNLSFPSSADVGISPSPTILKPRKFFKSRGPMEVEANSQQKPTRPEISNLMPTIHPPSLPLVSTGSPLIPSNINANVQYYADQGHLHHKKLKTKKTKKLENLSIPQPPLSSLSSSAESNFTSPPIKLRIFKDRGKFVAEAPKQDSLQLDHDTGKKRSKKRGPKSNKINTETEEQKPPKLTKRGKQTAAAMPPPPPPRPHGRTTRNSTKRAEPKTEDLSSGLIGQDLELGNYVDSTKNTPLTNKDTIQLAQQFPHIPTIMHTQLALNSPEGQQSARSLQLGTSESPAQEVIKKLEEDADFKKLSEMLSSMENDSMAQGSMGIAYSGSGEEGQIQTQQATPHQQQLELNTLPNYQRTHRDVNSLPANVRAAGDNNDDGAGAGLSAFATQAYNMHHQFRQQLDHHQEDYDQHHHHHHHSHNIHTGNVELDFSPQSSPLPPQQQQQSSSSILQVQQQQLIPKANDIRSILVDDWTDDLDDETHSPSGHNRSRPSSEASHHSQSPPKFSRFDMTAFLPSASGSGKQQQQESPPRFLSSESPTGGNEHQINAAHHQQQMSFNINSSPYAMRNLLNCPLEGQGQDSAFSTLGPDQLVSQSLAHRDASMSFPSCALESLQQHHTAPLNSLSNCAKQEAINALDSVLKQQEMTNEKGQSSQSLSFPLSTANVTGKGAQPQAPSTRKASIFKSRAREQSQNGEGNSLGTTVDNSAMNKGSKRLALYRHKFGGQEDPPAEDQNKQLYSQSSSHILNEFDDDEEDDHVRKSLRNVRIKNVKAVHQLQESGEFHEFDGDVQYILEDLRSKNPLNIRCLSAVTLATRCMEPSFRMHLRAHGTVAEFCRELHDSPQQTELALLAALVLFVLSQDRLNMDLDTDTLKLILALSKADDCNNDPCSQNSQDNLETLKHRQKVLDLCVEMKDRGHATHLKLDRITASELALETLLHLTSKRAGEWVKHELRSLGGLDSIVNEVDSALRFAQLELIQCGWTESALERLRKVDRCLQVLQQVTFNHEHNQKYLLGQSEREVDAVEGGVLQKCVEASPKIFVDWFRFCKENLLQLHMHLEPAAVLREISFSVLRVLVNLSHDYRGIVLGSEILMAMDGFLQLCLHSTFEMGRVFPDEKIFDLLMHSLCMLLNLVEHSRPCRDAILSSTLQKSSSGLYRVLESTSPHELSQNACEEISVLDAFVEMFVCRERAAKKEESNTDNILTKGPGEPSSPTQRGDKDGASQDKNSQDSEGSSLQDTIDKLIQTAGKHMENSLIAAYISLLLAYLIMDNPMAANHVRNSMPNGQYLPLMTFLKKLFNFMSITSSASGSIRGLKATAIALRFYAQADPASEEQLKRLIPD